MKQIDEVIKQFENAKEQLSAENAADQKNIEKYKDEIQELTKKITALENEIKSRETKIEKINQKLDETRKLNKSLEEVAPLISETKEAEKEEAAAPEKVEEPVFKNAEEEKTAPIDFTAELENIVNEDISFPHIGEDQPAEEQKKETAFPQFLGQEPMPYVNEEPVQKTATASEDLPPILDQEPMSFVKEEPAQKSATASEGFPPILDQAVKSTNNTESNEDLSKDLPPILDQENNDDTFNPFLNETVYNSIDQNTQSNGFPRKL